MAVINTVNIDSTDYTVLPGTLKFRARPDVVVKHNEPGVVIGYNYEGEFETDEDNIGSLVSSGQGSGSSTITITGFPTVYNAVVHVAKVGQGIQKSHVTFKGTKS